MQSKQLTTAFHTLGLLVLAIAAYWRVAQAEFTQFDDPDYVTQNQIVQQGLTWDGVEWAFGNLHGERTYWHPLTWLSHMLDCQLFGLDPRPPHLENLTLHFLNAWLVFLVLQRMTGAAWRSFLVAALWLVHPLQVETVAWVTERKNLLSTFFLLLGIAAYVRYAARPGVLRYLSVFACMALGLMCKPVLVTMPFVLLLLDFWPLQRTRILPKAGQASGLPSRAERGESVADPAPGQAGGPPYATAALPRLVLEKLPLLALSALASLVTLLAHGGLESTADSAVLPWNLRVANACVSYARYLFKVFWPTDLGVFYPHPIHWPSWAFVGSLLFLLVLTAVLLWKARTRPWLAVGWAWFLGMLVPAIGLVQAGSQAMADRFAYQSLIGLFVLVVWGGAELASRSKPQVHVAPASGGRSPSPPSGEGRGEEGRRRGEKLGLHASGVAAAATVFALLACVLLTHRQVGYWRNSVTLWKHTIAVTPTNATAEMNLGSALFAVGRASEAQPHAARALQLDPSSVLTRQLLADILAAEGKFDEALILLESSARQWPSEPALHLQLAYFLTARGRAAEAITHYQIALRLKQDMLQALNNLAWLLATHPADSLRNGAEAVRLAERACELSGYRKAMLLGTLAAAYAEAGRFPDAVRAAQQARDLALAAGQSELAATNTRLLELYQAGKPYRETQMPR